GDGARVGDEDDGQVWRVGELVDTGQEREVEAVGALHHQAGGEVPVAQHDAAGGSAWTDLGVKVVVAIGSEQARQHRAASDRYQIAGQRSDGAARRLRRAVYRQPSTVQ